MFRRRWYYCIITSALYYGKLKKQNATRMI